ncbi:MAG: sugar transferase, partial [Gammaproteobacteria bacterium]
RGHRLDRVHDHIADRLAEAAGVGFDAVAGLHFIDEADSRMRGCGRVDAERGTGPQWSTRGDDRVTRVGAVMRRFRIDELPQMINIIRGDMSVVGPRPERPAFVEELSGEVPLYYYRHGVRPGLTGWAQLNFPYGASVDDAREKLKYDLYYIKNASLILDLLILVQTVEVVVWGRATTMAGGPRPRSPDDQGPEQSSEALRDARESDAL